MTEHCQIAFKHAGVFDGDRRLGHEQCDEHGATFRNAGDFNQDIGRSRDTSETQTWESMLGLRVFSSSGWDTSNVTGMQYMVRHCRLLLQDIGNWNTSEASGGPNVIFNRTSAAQANMVLRRQSLNQLAAGNRDHFVVRGRSPKALMLGPQLTSEVTQPMPECIGFLPESAVSGWSPSAIGPENTPK